jgi:nitrite reductase/ring-hydroxylating ferredoxin subunit/uncharacterized membrane protein
VASVTESIAVQIEQLERLDRVGKPLQDAARGFFAQKSQLKDLVSGTWLGHPVHPPLTDAVIGTWTSALFLDLLGGDQTEEAADRLVAIGILAAIPTAATGLSDWAELDDGNRRLGTVHAAGNTTALMLHALSWLARRRGDRRLGVALSATGYGLATCSAVLGGHLSFGKGVGVNQTAFEAGPGEWTAVYDEAALVDGRLTRAEANGVGVLLVRCSGRIHALVDRCSHRGCSLHEGQLTDSTIECPCHGSTFRLDGSLVKGPATASQPAFEVRTREGRVEIRTPAASSST